MTNIEENQPEEASADAAPEGAADEARPDDAQDETRDSEDALTDPDPEQQDPESGPAAGEDG